MMFGSPWLEDGKWPCLARGLLCCFRGCVVVVVVFL